MDLAAEDDKLFLRFESTGLAEISMRHDQACCCVMVMHGGRIVEITAHLDTDLIRSMMA